ncbi:hypothetical protein ACQCSU_21925 (plasmid) [Pseudarthrobacter sp. O4]|uniref:hypothetical protein n=1 Tax=Pseudarthrobacter sp. O4 TaxID=3418417 RepID=UPI003CFA94FF
MGLIYDDPQLAALTLTRIAAEEAEGPGELTGRMHAILDDLMQRNGADYLDDFARVTRTSTAQLLDSAEIEALEGLDAVQ